MGHPARAESAMPQEVASDHQYLTFMLGDELFAIDILNIRQIIEFLRGCHVLSVDELAELVRDNLNLAPLSS